MSIISKITTAGAGLGAGLGTAYDYLTPGKGSSRLTNATYDYFTPSSAYNGANINPNIKPAAPSAQVTANQTGIDQASAQWQAILKGLNSYTAPAPVYAPKKDFAAIGASARANAENAVNPLYTAYLNDFLTQQAHQKAQEQATHDTNVTNLQDTLNQTLEQNDITKGRTTEDVNKNIADTNLQADQFQTDSGQQFNTDRLAAAKNASTGGLGQKSLETAQANRNTQEGRQVAKFKDAVDTQNLFKQRTFDDLARSGELATKGETKGVAKENFDLESYITNAADAETQYRNEQNQKRLADIAQEQQRQDQLLTNSWIESIANPAQRNAARMAYG